MLFFTLVTFKWLFSYCAVFPLFECSVIMLCCECVNKTLDLAQKFACLVQKNPQQQQNYDKQMIIMMRNNDKWKGNSLVSIHLKYSNSRKRCKQIGVYMNTENNFVPLKTLKRGYDRKQ